MPMVPPNPTTEFSLFKSSEERMRAASRFANKKALPNLQQNHQRVLNYYSH
jgi:hypothetical protein